MSDEHQTIQHTVLYDAAARANSTRVCGDCQLCCKLVPVSSIGKPANTRCRHQRVGKGCLVYHQAGMPPECDLWSCKWLLGGETADLQRPDRVHYVIDMMPDMIGAIPPGSSERHDVMVTQVWLDPAFPLAHRDPGLRGYAEQIAARDQMPILVRIGSSEAFLLVAPSLASDGQWHEQSINRQPEQPKHGMMFLDRMMGE